MTIARSPPPPRKVLVIHFKLLGDLVLATPALRALKQRYPDCELHVATSTVNAPLLQRLPWIRRVWALPREGAGAAWRTWRPLVAQMRAQRFDVCVDLIGNDRGALLSLLSGARARVGRVPERGFRLRRLLYTHPVEEFDTTRHESLAHWYTVSCLDVPPPASFAAELVADPALAQQARAYLGEARYLCFINASLPKKEWPLARWVEFFRLARADGLALAFTGGNRPRELELFTQLRSLAPEVPCLVPGVPLDLLLATFAQLRGFIGNDTGPLHMAAALGVPTVGLFGPEAASKWRPLGPAHQALQGGLCTCSGHVRRCERTDPCVAATKAEEVLEAVRRMPSHDALAPWARATTTLP